MRSGFVNGMLFGTIAGAMIGMYYYPKMKQTPQKYFTRRAGRMGRGAGRFMSDMAREVQGYMGR